MLFVVASTDTARAAAPHRLPRESRGLLVRWFRAMRCRLPRTSSLLARLRLLFVGIALASLAGMVPLLAVTGMPFVTRVGAESIVGGLGIYWIWGMRRGGFPTIADGAHDHPARARSWTAGGRRGNRDQG